MTSLAKPTAVSAIDESPRAWQAWIANAVIAGALTFGVALRLRSLLANRSLWLDEAMLALNICGRDFAGLLRPLDENQGAPLGFLELEKLAVLTLGPSELALRLVPFLASIVSMVLIYAFCRTHFGRQGAIVGATMAAVSPGMISYAGEAKQYSVDAAVALAILTAAAHALREGVTPRRAAILAIVGSVAVWFSHPAAFVLAGVGTTLFLTEAARRRPVPALLAATASACWLASFAASYVLSLRDLHSSTYLMDFWEKKFLSFPPRSIEDIRDYMSVGLGIFETPYNNLKMRQNNLQSRMSAIAAAAWLSGVVLLLRKGERGLASLLVSPLAFALLGVFLHKYPLHQRLALFTTGPTMLASVAGLAILLRSQEGLTRAVGGVLVAGMLFLPAVQDAQFLAERPKPFGARTAVTRIAREWRPGDTLLVDGFADPPFRWYRAYGGIDGVERLEPTESPGFANPDAARSILREMKGRPRVWLLITAPSVVETGWQEFLRSTLDQFGKSIDTKQNQDNDAYNIQCYLYDFSIPAPIRERLSPKVEPEAVAH